MADQAGIFIAIEGTDGAGKSTHFELLTDKLRTAGYDVATFDFPQYNEPSTYFVKRYLSGAYGSADSVGPYTASLFYSLDRYEAAPLIRQALADGKVVISNRYTGSNMAHQGTKFRNAEERRGFFIWLDNLEYQMLNIPRPDINLVLRVPAEISSKLATQKQQPKYLGSQSDIHESDLSHLERSVEVYDDLCNLFPKDFARIDCVRGGDLLPIEAIHKLIWEKISPQLPRPPRRRNAKHVAAVQPSEPTTSDPVHHLPSGTIITNAGFELLSSAVSQHDSISVINDELPQAVVAQVLATLPESDQEISVSLLEEYFRQQHQSTEQSGYRTRRIEDYISSRFILEEASQLTLMHVSAAGREIAISEQLLASSDLASRDKHGRYHYYVPPELDSATKTTYCDSLDRIFDAYGRILQVLTSEALIAGNAAKIERTARRIAGDVLPLATTSRAGSFASGRQLEHLIVGLESSPLTEARHIASGLLEELGNSLPDFRDRLSKMFDRSSDSQPSSQTQLKELSTTLVADDYDVSPTDAVILTNVKPRNELDLVPDMLYAVANKSLNFIREQAGSWTYDQKFEAFETYFGNRNALADGYLLDDVRYGWDIVTDVASFRMLQRQLPAGTTSWQSPTPRYGYDVTSVIEDAGLSDELEQCFDLSLRLFSQLQQAGFEEQAQYAVLLGHKIRGTVSLSGRQAGSFFAEFGNSKLSRQMLEKLAEKHPLLAEKLLA